MGAQIAPNNATNNNKKQPISPVVKLICQQQAKEFQAKYNTESMKNGNYPGNVLGGGTGGAGVGQTFVGILMGFLFNDAQSNTAYEIGYQECISGQYP